MRYRDVCVNRSARNADRLVHRARPKKAPRTFYDAFAVVDERAAPFAHAIEQHISVGGAVQSRFERQKRVSVRGQQHVVRVQPHDIIRRREGKRKISCRGKIVLPAVFGEYVRVLSRDLFGLIRRARIRDRDVVEYAFYAFEAAGEHLFFVFNDHAQSESHPCSSSVFHLRGVLVPVFT